MSNEKTHYDALGVANNATTSEIKKAFRKIALENHPDKTGHLPEAEKAAKEEIFKAANEAHEILTDSTKRTEYDTELNEVNIVKQQAEQQRRAEETNRHARQTARKEAGYTDLHDAAAKGDVKKIEALANDNNINKPMSKTGHTPLHVAVAKGNDAAARALIESGADVNAKMFNGFTPLHIAVCNDQKHMVDLLHKEGGDLNQPLTTSKEDLQNYFKHNHNDEKTIKRVERFIENNAKGDNVSVTPNDMAFLLGRKNLIRDLQTNKKTDIDLDLDHDSGSTFRPN